MIASMPHGKNIRRRAPDVGQVYLSNCKSENSVKCVIRFALTLQSTLTNELKRSSVSFRVGGNKCMGVLAAHNRKDVNLLFRLL